MLANDISLDCFRGDVSNNGGTLSINTSGKGLYCYCDFKDGEYTLGDSSTNTVKFFELDQDGNVVDESECDLGSTLSGRGVLYIYDQNGRTVYPSNGVTTIEIDEKFNINKLV
jgi:hypothetical protein